MVLLVDHHFNIIPYNIIVKRVNATLKSDVHNSGVLTQYFIQLH